MADINNSIALQAQTPSFVSTVGGLLGLKQQQQALQQAQQGVEQQNIQLQSQRQANQERQNFISLGIKPGDDGYFDLSPQNTARIMDAMHQTGAATIQTLADTNDKMRAAREGIQGLSAKSQDLFAKDWTSLIGQKTSVKVAARDASVAQNPELKPFWDQALHVQQQIDGAPLTDTARQKAQTDADSHFSRFISDVKTQQEMATPAATNIGGALMNYKPGVPGFPVGSKISDTTLTPGERSNVIIAPGSNQPVTINKEPSGVGATVTPTQIGGGNAAPVTNPSPLSKVTSPSAGIVPIRSAPLFPTPQDAATATAAQTRWQQVREQDSNPQSGYNATKQVYANLVPLVSTAKVGPGASQFNQVTGRVATALGIPANTPYQEVAAYLDRLAAQTSQSTGAATNFAREQAASATGTGEMNTDALAEKLRFGASINEASHAYATASQAFAAKHGGNAFYNSNAFDSAWTRNADPLAFRLRAAKANGDMEDYNATLARVRDLPLPKQHAIFQHAKNLSTLESGDVPQ